MNIVVRGIKVIQVTLLLVSVRSLTAAYPAAISHQHLPFQKDHQAIQPTDTASVKMAEIYQETVTTF